MFNKAHYLIRLENDPDQHMAGNNQKYDVKKYPDRLWCIKLTGWMYLLDFFNGCAKYSAQDSRQVNYHSFSFSRESNKPTLKKSFVWDIFSVVQAPCKHHAYTFKDHESATEAQCKHIASWQCEHLWSTIKSTACVHLCVRSSRRKTRGPVAEGDHARKRAPLAWIK